MVKDVLIAFIGAGPGDPELITVKGKRFIEEADLVLYAGSLVPKELVSTAKKEATVLDSSSMTLEETHAAMLVAVRAGKKVARVHTGDPSLYGTVHEQTALLRAEGVAYQIIPGVTAAFAAAAAAAVSLTSPESVQSAIIARIDGRTPVPDSQTIRRLAAHGASMAVYLSASDGEKLERELLEGGVDPKTLVIAAYRVGWSEQKIVKTQVGRLAQTVREEGFSRQTVFLVLPGNKDGVEDSGRSKLYDGDFSHGFRKGKSNV